MNKRLLGYCIECKEPIYEGEKNIKFIPNKGLVHFDEDNVLNNCYYPEEENE